MANVAGIRFKRCGKIYDFETDGLEVEKGELVIVESEFGLSIGSIVIPPRTIEETEREFKKVVRIATEEDLKQRDANRGFEKDALAFCQERIMARGLPMNLVCTEVTLDRKRIVFYFTAEGRIDFRELVKDLAAKFKTRIEMRQIGVRDKAKMIGGLGICGKPLCCRQFLTSFEPISIKMAKQQELVLSTGKLSGVCGRLMCCLGFEYDSVVTQGTVQAEDGTIQVTEEEEVLERLSVDPGEKGPEKESAAAAGTSVPPATGGAQEQSGQPGRRKRRRRRRRGRFKKKDGS